MGQRGESGTAFQHFHEVELPRRLSEGNGALAASDAAQLGTIAFRIAGTETGYTYRSTGADVVVEAGDLGADTVIELSQESWDGLVGDVETAPGLLYSDRVSCPVGNPLRFVRWEPALRAMFHGRPIYPPQGLALVDRHGAPLDVKRSFVLDDDRADMADHLEVAGYLLVKGVFSADEVRRLDDATGRLRSGAVEGDGRSWWGRNSAGEAVLCRVTHAAREPALRELCTDERLLSLGSLSSCSLSLRDPTGDEGAEVLWKVPDVVEGLADLPWHRDCGMGGHATMCPLLIATVCTTGRGAASGELRMLPGSWRYSFPFLDADDPSAPRSVGLDVEPGDVTLHYGDMMHASLAPYGEGPHRTSILLAFVPDSLPYSESDFREALIKGDDGQVDHLRDRLAKAT